MVVNLLNRKELSDVDWHLALVIKQITELCQTLDSVIFSHIPQEWNGVADCLAKWASEYMQDWNITDQRHLPLELSHELDQLVA